MKIFQFMNSIHHNRKVMMRKTFLIYSMKKLMKNILLFYFFKMMPSLNLLIKIYWENYILYQSQLDQKHHLKIQQIIWTGNYRPKLVIKFDQLHMGMENLYQYVQMVVEEFDLQTMEQTGIQKQLQIQIIISGL